MVAVEVDRMACNEAIIELFSFLEGRIGRVGGTNFYLGMTVLKNDSGGMI